MTKFIYFVSQFLVWHYRVRVTPLYYSLAIYSFFYKCVILSSNVNTPHSLFRTNCLAISTVGLTFFTRSLGLQINSTFFLLATGSCFCLELLQRTDISSLLLTLHRRSLVTSLLINHK